MKKQILFLVMMLLPMMASAQSSVKIDGIYYKLNSVNKTAEVVASCFRYTGNVVIPSSVTYEGVDYSVTGIGNQAFYASVDLTSVSIPNSVASIGKSAFSGCSGLTSITIPDGVKDIGEMAFLSCSSLNSVYVGCGVKSIGEIAFNDCDNLTKVELNNNAIVSKTYEYESGSSIKDIFGTQVKEYVLGEDVTNIGDGVFYNCTDLFSVHMSDKVTRIGKGAFYRCTGLTNINISDNLTSIGILAFSDCSHLASITIPAGVTRFDEYTFNGCGRLARVEINSNALVSKQYIPQNSLATFFGPQVEEYVLGEEVTSIGQCAFYQCTKLTSINIHNHVTTIGSEAFYDCYGLTSINIPSTVKSIGEDAFYNCNGLLSIEVESGNTVYDSRDNCNALINTASNTLIQGCQNTVIPNNVTSIGDYAFLSCSGLTSINIPNSVRNIGNYAFSGCTGLTTISIPNGVTTIGQYAFSSCSGLTSIKISNSVTNIGYRAFTLCIGLAAIQVESGNTVYDSRDNCNAIIETANNTLIQGCMNTIIPNNVTAIAECAFWGCSGLTTISIPNSVKTIGPNAFLGCSDLTFVTISNSVTSIDYYAFYNCLSLVTVIIPNSVTSIGKGAFFNTGLKDMYSYAEQVPKTDYDIFDFTYPQATLHVPAGSIDAYRNAKQWKDFKEIVALPVQDDYRNMVKDGIVWKTGIHGSGNPVQHVEYFYFDGDTIIDGKTCKQMMCQQYYNLDASDDAYISQSSPLSYVGAWYEEDKKVYTYDTTSMQFVLMYDFSVDANDTLLINQDDYYVIGPRQTGGLRGFKGVYRDVWFLAEEGPIYSPTWLEGVGSIDGPTTNVYSGYVDPLRFLMLCTDDDEVIYFNDEYEDGATPKELNANKHRFDFTHTVKTKPKAPRMGGEERQKGIASADLQSLYGEYDQQQLSIHLDSLVETYVVCITNESNEIVYEKSINTVDIVGLNIDISTYAKGCYTATVENSNESFVGEFEVQATGIETITNKKEDAITYIYNLQGQRIRFLQKGLNIVNGRKVYVK